MINNTEKSAIENIQFYLTKLEEQTEQLKAMISVLSLDNAYLTTRVKELESKEKVSV